MEAAGIEPVGENVGSGTNSGREPDGSGSLRAETVSGHKVITGNDVDKRTEQGGGGVNQGRQKCIKSAVPDAEMHKICSTIEGLPPELSRLLEAWPKIPDSLKAVIMAAIDPFAGQADTDTDLAPLDANLSALDSNLSALDNELPPLEIELSDKKNAR